MDECDLQAEEAATRLGIDQLGAGCLELCQRGADVVDLVGDVMHPRPTLRQELAYGSLRAERGEELDAALADADGCGLDALIRNGFAVLEPSAEEPLVRRYRLVEVDDCEAEMMDAARLHPGRC